MRSRSGAVLLQTREVDGVKAELAKAGKLQIPA
jgi:hypothetical protein